ncbi:C26 family cysteine hydrolase domain-containing family [Permianibacter sp. IMCC34836]|uniref:gamma-glutamyl-gamma-aminobutyrate hydrolase family protein n=1 Tax=Permianibacter fluminis TaxID=2738515 RepID=UPI0015519713|nr:gamma-glutamyl-gamma-aminobutyrate hydrolase family protein [Permianibacter fluminis]NQD36179.1 C26 family cysteine hydrolase domain-containing family [Permianibacter fluminis]
MTNHHPRPLLIGISARLFHPEPSATGIRTKTLQYLEQSAAHWLMSRDVLVLMIPTVLTDGPILSSNIRLRDYARYLDGLVLQGGADVHPGAYGETALQPEWAGDAVRDAYEMELLHEFLEAKKPILAICRGCQLLNVALGGSLYQDIATQLPDAETHVSAAYDQHSHLAQFGADSWFRQWYGDSPARISSIHHQAIKTLGKDLQIEMQADDGIIEAVRHREHPFCVGVQWHPEFHLFQKQHGHDDWLDPQPLLEAFLAAARHNHSTITPR